MNKRIIPMLFVATALMLTGCGKKTNSQNGSADNSGGDTSTPTSGQTSGQQGDYTTLEITPENMGGKMDAAGPYSHTYDGLTVSVSRGLIDQNQATTNWEIRIYKNYSITFTATELKKIEFTCVANGSAERGPGNFTTASGGYTFEEAGPKGTWEGSAASVEFKAETSQVRCLTISVTYKK